jgi:glutathione S-transferase
LQGAAYLRIHYAESNIMMLNVMALVFLRMPEAAPFFLKPLMKIIANKAEQGAVFRPLYPLLIAAFYGPQLKLHGQFIEDELAKSTWFIGDELTGAGISFDCR